MLHAKM